MEIPKLLALKGRLPSNHPKQPLIEAKYKNKMAGYKGEKSLDFYLSMLPDSNYFIFYGLRLLYQEYYFQMDILLLSTHFALILEVKNIAGELYFDRDFGQMIRSIKGVKERYKNPVAQARLQAIKFKKWLQDRHIEIPILYLFVNSNNKTELVSESKTMTRNMCNSEFLLEKITQLEGSYMGESLNIKELRKVKRLLLSNHAPENPDVLKNFDISPNELLTGVRCPKCLYLPMFYQSGKWNCPNCKEISKTAHSQAIQDYFLLQKPSITSSELRNLLHLTSPRVAHKILTSLNLPFTGKFKNRVYHQNNFSFMHKDEIIHIK